MRVHGYDIKQVETEQWFGTEWAASKGGKVVREDGADEGHWFGRLRLALWALFKG